LYNGNSSGTTPSSNNKLRHNTPRPDQPKSDLSEKERAELLAAGKCFRCKEQGHLSRNCPKGNSVKSNNNRPPGLSNYNTELEIGPEEELQVLDNLELVMIEFDDQHFSLPDWRNYEPD